MTVDLNLLVPSSRPTLRIAIIGANGHVGAAVVTQALQQGHSVLALDRDPVGPGDPQQDARYEYRQVDATDSRAFVRELRGCTACVHLAAVYSLHDDEGRVLNEELSQAQDILNINAAMSYNALTACAELGIERIVLASSVNAMGLIHCKRPRIDYVPVDELHPQRPEDAYSLSKSICELQASSIARRYPSLRVASLRFHWVVPSHKVDPQILHSEGGAWKDLWGWVSLGATADACLKGLTASRDIFPCGHEVFIIAAKTTCRQEDSDKLLRTMYMPEKEGMNVRIDYCGTNRGFWDASKAERMLGWKEEGWAWQR